MAIIFFKTFKNTPFNSRTFKGNFNNIFKFKNIRCEHTYKKMSLWRQLQTLWVECQTVPRKELLWLWLRIDYQMPVWRSHRYQSFQSQSCLGTDHITLPGSKHMCAKKVPVILRVSSTTKKNLEYYSTLKKFTTRYLHKKLKLRQYLLCRDTHCGHATPTAFHTDVPLYNIIICDKVDRQK